MAIVDSTMALPSGAPAPFPTRHAPRRTSVRPVTLLHRSNDVGDTGTQMTPLYVREGDTFRAAPADQVLLQAQELIDQQFRSRMVLGNPQSVRRFLKIQLGGRVLMRCLPPSFLTHIIG